jgi:hypothetical protein
MLRVRRDLLQITLALLSKLRRDSNPTEERQEDVDTSGFVEYIFPIEIWGIILGALKFLELLKLVSVCKEFYRACFRLVSVLEHHDLHKLPDHLLPKFKNLHTLEIAWHERFSNENVRTLTQLQKIDLYENPMINNRTVQKLSNLTTLSLKENEKVSNSGIKKLTGLTKLNLKKNGLISNIGTLVNLRNLNLNYNTKITDKDIKYLTLLEKLDLTNNPSISNKGLKRLTQLRNLNLSKVQDFDGQDVPIDFGPRYLNNDGITHLFDLDTLNLKKEENITIEGISGLRNLTCLNLSRNQNFNDEDMSLLTQLKSLNLSKNNKITNLGLSKLSNLTKLKLRKNENITLEGLNNLVNLREIVLNENIQYVVVRDRFDVVLRYEKYHEAVKYEIELLFGEHLSAELKDHLYKTYCHIRIV